MPKRKRNKSYRIHVTPEDIMKGVQGDASACPIQRAVERTTKMENVVYGYSIRIAGQQFDLPKKCDQFVDRFDGGGPNKVRPFCFTLRIPNE